MFDEVEHVDNDTPNATDDDVKRVDEDGLLLGTTAPARA